MHTEFGECDRKYMSKISVLNMQQISVKRGARNIIAFAFLELVLVLAISIIALRLWRIDFSVPFNYTGDTLWFLVPIKGMIENGLPYEIPQLSAPFGLSVAAFPSMTNLDWLIMKAIALFVKDAGTVLNVFWLVSIVLTAWSATLALNLLGLGKWSAFGLGVVYSFLPFALLRNVAHISLVFYCVPLLVLLAIYFARGCEHPRANTVRLIGYCGALAQGFNYIYFSFFAVLLFTFAGWLGFNQKRSWKPVKEATIAVGIIILAASINLLPSFLSWHTYGKPPGLGYKSAQEAEVYGLKIRKMLVPNEYTSVPILSQWARSDKSSGFPNENENVTARLGPMAAVGFLLLLMVSAGLAGQQHTKESSVIRPIASLTLFTLLFTTVGGFGAIFSQIIPDFRGLNRFSVFIAFLALAGVGLWWQAQMQVAATKVRKKFLVGGFIVLLVFTLYDQLLDSGHLNNRRPNDELVAMREKEFVKLIEAKVPLGASIFQLPTVNFVTGRGKERMEAYDQARPYLWSTHLHWSWPSISRQHQAWMNHLVDMDGAELAEALVLSNFRLIWVDRYGYKDDGDRLISSLTAIGAKDILPNLSPRYVVLDLATIAERLKMKLGAEAFAERQADLLAAPSMTWGRGAYGFETNGEGRKFQWSQAQSSVEIFSSSGDPWVGVLSFSVASGGKPGKFTVSNETHTGTVTVTTMPVHIDFPVSLKANSTVEVRFVGDMGKMDLPAGETRDLHFSLMDMGLRRAIGSKSKFGAKSGS